MNWPVLTPSYTESETNNCSASYIAIISSEYALKPEIAKATAISLWAAECI